MAAAPRPEPASGGGPLGRLSALLRRLADLPKGGLSIAWITPSLAQGPAPRSGQYASLRRTGVTSVLDLRAESEADVTAVAHSGLRYRRVPVPDRYAPDASTLKEAVDWVMDEIAGDGRVFIHCRAGAGRSPFVACAVLMRMGFDLSTAYDTVRRQRPEMVLTESQVEALEKLGRGPHPDPPPAGHPPPAEREKRRG